MLNRDLDIEWLPTTPWRYYNYAILHNKGVTQLFDTMRYDNAFLVREDDLNTLIDLAKDDGHYRHITSHVSILLCRHADKGVKNPGWNPQRLLLTQKYEYVNDAQKLMDIAPNVITSLGFQPKPTNKMIGIFTVKGDLPYVLRVMFHNKCMPASEGMAREIEQAFYKPDDEFEARLVRFAPKPVEIIMPKKE